MRQVIDTSCIAEPRPEQSRAGADRIEGRRCASTHTCTAGGGAGGMAFLDLISWMPGAMAGIGAVYFGTAGGLGW